MALSMYLCFSRNIVSCLNYSLVLSLRLDHYKRERCFHLGCMSSRLPNFHSSPISDAELAAARQSSIAPSCKRTPEYRIFASYFLPDFAIHRQLLTSQKRFQPMNQAQARLSQPRC